MKELSVGVSVFATDDANIWSSGINQNIAFLVMCLQRMPGVKRVVLLNGGSSDHLPSTLAFDGLGVPLCRPQDVTHDLDVVIEMGAKLPQSWIRHVKALGVRVVAFLVGNPHSAMIEPAIFGRHAAIGLVGMEPDEVWMLHGHLGVSESAIRSILRAPVVEMPHMWAPIFLERELAHLGPAVSDYRFDPRGGGKDAAGWRIAIFEPNISVVKNYITPMLACDAAYRKEPDAVAHMMVMNSFHMKEHLTFNRFATVLDLTRDGRASYEPRITVPECMTRFNRNMIVSHQWGNEQNYLYYDALFGGYPLIHNSGWLHDKGMGIFYPGFAAEEAGNAIIEALHKPVEFWDDYFAGSREFLETIHPCHETNVAAVAARLAPEVFEAKRLVL